MPEPFCLRALFYGRFVPWLLLATPGISPVLFATEPPDSLSGPPFVSCKAWGIAEGSGGKLLWGHDVDVRLHAASTTKIMCALVVCELADKNPEIMDERVTFSKLADQTTGSTAGIKAGESLPVWECLYGLMLPSGNDAGNALAEHFHSRLAPPGNLTIDERDSRGTSTDTRANFIAEMNRTAQRLGMKQTTYGSPYGDRGGQDNPTTTVRDLLHLAWFAMQNPRLRTYVSTPRYECEVQRPDLSTRTVIWENTNELLKIQGYDGVKTGTNTPAGACLVSSGRRDDDHLLVVVLGSTSRHGRYVDSRNLYRWAWRQRGHQP